jgi:YegS/Rv2252/BmrU family lipid kinase
VKLTASLGACDTRFTEAPGHATAIARELLREGYGLIVAAGGDGTVNEVANGFLDPVSGAPLSADPALGILPLGTGGDFRRTLGIGPRDAIDILASGAERRIDMGKARYLGFDDAMHTRYFINVVSFGMGGEVAARSHNFLSPASGKAAFLLATLETCFRYGGKRVRFTTDDNIGSHSFPVTNVAIGNGRYHGGGMHVCPKALIDDGALDVTVIEYLPLHELALNLPTLYSDNLYRHRKTHHFRARRVRAESDETVRIEIDGEPLGALPLEVTVLPGAMRVVCP